MTVKIDEVTGLVILVGYFDGPNDVMLEDSLLVYSLRLDDGTSLCSSYLFLMYLKISLLNAKY